MLYCLFHFYSEVNYFGWQSYHSISKGTHQCWFCSDATPVSGCDWSYAINVSRDRMDPDCILHEHTEGACAVPEQTRQIVQESRVALDDRAKNGVHPSFLGQASVPTNPPWQVSVMRSTETIIQWEGRCFWIQIRLWSQWLNRFYIHIKYFQRRFFHNKDGYF